MLKRWISVCLTWALVFTLCGVATAEEETVTLSVSFWTSADEQETKMGLFEEFQKQHPNIKLDLTYCGGGDYPVKLQTMLVGNQAPDVMAIASDVMDPFLGQGYFEDLTPYMEKDGLTNEWVQSGIDTFTYDGEIFAAPFVSKVMCIVYNKEIFDAAGIAYPSEDWTEAEMLDAAKKLTSGEGVERTWGFYWSWMAAEMMRNLYGSAPVYDADTMTMQAKDNAAFRHTMELFEQMLLKDNSSPDPVSQSSISGGFESGKFAMSIAITAGLENIAKMIGDSFEWGVVALPVSEQYGPWSSTLRLDGFMMSSQSAHKEAAWELIRYLTADREALIRAGSTGIPMAKQILEDEEVMNGMYPSCDFDRSLLTRTIERASSFHGAGIFAELNTVVDENYQAFILGDYDLDTMLEEMQAQGEEILAQ